MPAAITAEARCACHPHETAVDVCSRCGSFVCAGCEEISTSNEVFCASCFERVKSGAPTARSYLGRVLLGLGVLAMSAVFVTGLLFGPFALVFGVPGMVLTMFERGRHIAVPKWVFALGLVFVLQLAVVLAFAAWLLLTAHSRG